MTDTSAPPSTAAPATQSDTPPGWRTRSYGWDATRPDPRVLAAMSGLELIRAMTEGRIPAASIAATLDFRLVEVEEGRVVFEGSPGPHVLNPLGTVHGGYAATLLDSAMGCAVHTTLPAATGYGTVELKVNYLRPILADGGPIRVEGKVIHGGRTLAVAEARLTGVADGKLYAHGTSTCMITPMGRPGA